VPEFNRDAQKRITRMVRDRELKPQGEAKAPPPPTIILPIRNAKVTAAISGRTTVGGKPRKGSGTVTLYVDDETGTGDMVVFQANIKAWCNYLLTAPIAVDKWVYVGIVDGLNQVLGGDC